MRGPVVETVLLLLLVGYFAIQQKDRPHLYFRFWLVGWAFVLWSLTAWELEIDGLTKWILILVEIIRYDLLAMGGLCFTVSLLITRKGLGKSLLQVGVLAFVGLAGIDLQIIPGIPKSVLLPGLLIPLLAAEIGGITMMQRMLPAQWTVRKRLLMVLYVSSAAAIIVKAIHDPSSDTADPLVGQIFLCAAVHYAATFRRSLAGMMGALGLALWGIGYFLVGFEHQMPLTLQNIYTFWNLPKYFVGLAMLLRVLEVESEEKARLLEELRALYSDFKGLYESHPQPVWIYDKEAQQIASVNAAALEAYGYSEEAFLKLQPLDLISGWDEEFDDTERMLPPTPDGRRERHQCSDGRHVWMHIVERQIVFQQREARLVLARDITDRLRANRQLAFQAHHDPLTGLPNRTLLADRLEGCLEVCARDGRRAAVLAIDIDYFKRVNDKHGHLAGDACLKAVAARLQSRVRQTDTLARIGGEEFVCVVGQVQQMEDARKVALMLLRQFDESIKVEGYELPVTVSIGVAIYPEDGTSPGELQSRADEALYEAKRRGRARVVLAQEMDSRVRNRSLL
jgi:diguanylate cyclase (GGDEF)-like protein/PAS domain S-box-containing protein